MSIELLPRYTTLPTIGYHRALDLTVYDGNGREVHPSLLVWSSSDPEIVQVDDKGWITALGDGAATITVSVGDAAKSSARIVVDSRVGHKAFIRSVANPWTSSQRSKSEAELHVHENKATD